MRRDLLLIGLLAVIVGTLAAVMIAHPGYTDAYYYMNAARRLIQGQGLTDAAIWTYIAAPRGLPIPSHLYWLPMTSFIAAGGMGLGQLIGIPATFDTAQILFVPLYVGLALGAYWLGVQLGRSRRIGWLAALFMIFSGFYLPYWLTTATFAPFGVAGAGALIGIGLGRRNGDWRGFALAGVLCGVAHLTRADGLLLLFVLILIAVWPNPVARQGYRRTAIRSVLAGVLGYLIVMLPWFIRNITVTGAILPAGGLETAWMRSYDEIVNYPPGVDLRNFLTWGISNVFRSRWDALLNNMARFVAEQGLIVLTPFLLIGLWRRRRDPLLSGLLLYAPGLFLVMTVVFALPGARGGLFHSAAALMPFWMALGAAGLDDVITWAAKRRRWPVGQARAVFGAAAVAWTAYLSLSALNGKAAEWNNAGAYFESLALPREAVAMINDPSALYYFTGIPGVVLPNAPPEVIADIAERYGVTHVIIDADRTEPMKPLWERKNVPFFLEHRYADGRVRIYTVRDNYNPPD